MNPNEAPETPNVFQEPAEPTKEALSSSSNSSESSTESEPETFNKQKFEDIPDSKKSFAALEGAMGVEKWVEVAGTCDFEDLQKENSPWKGNDRNLVTEFLFRLRVGGEEEVKWNVEDPEEFVVYNRELKEGQKTNPRWEIFWFGENKIL